MSFLENLEWRYATKIFDTQKKVSPENREKILEAIRMTPTSFGMQSYHVIMVENEKMKQSIQEISWNQPQITTCSDLVIFCAKTDLMKAKDEYFTMLSEGNPEKRKSLESFEQMVGGFIQQKNKDAISWSEKQTYIALGFAMAACAELHIDSCPMEGFDANALTKILSLPETLTPTLMLPIGYRTADAEIRPKVRFPEESLISFL